MSHLLLQQHDSYQGLTCVCIVLSCCRSLSDRTFQSKVLRKPRGHQLHQQRARKLQLHRRESYSMHYYVCNTVSFCNVGEVLCHVEDSSSSKSQCQPVRDVSETQPASAGIILELGFFAPIETDRCPPSSMSFMQQSHKVNLPASLLLYTRTLLL